VQVFAAEFRLGSVDERFHCVLRSSAGGEFAISAPPSRMARQPDVSDRVIALLGNNSLILKAFRPLGGEVASGCRRGHVASGHALRAATQ